MYQSAKELANKVLNRFGRTIDNATGRVVATVTGLAFTVGSAHAIGTDYTTLTAGVDFTTVIAAVLAVALIMAGVYTSIKGAKIVLGILRSA